MQARSSASVEAILHATIQVLLKEGKQRLTTTRVAHRAGVSVGTLYQYFPNKSALLQATLRRHLNQVTVAVERICQEQRGKTLREMVTALVNAFLDAKMQDAKTSVALYAVSSDVDGVKLSREMGARTGKAIVEVLATAREPLEADASLVATILQGALAGVSRRMLESGAPEKQIEALRRELIVMACAYVEAHVVNTSKPGAGSINSFIGVLAGKTKKVATIKEINEAAAAGWAGEE